MARHAVWVDSDSNVARCTGVFQMAGLQMHHYGATADALAGFGRDFPSSDALVLVVTSMMRRDGRQAQGLMDGLHMLDKFRFKLQVEVATSVRPIFAVISKTADEQECSDHAVDVLVKNKRDVFQKKVLQILDCQTDRSWRTNYRLNALPQDCRRLHAQALILQTKLLKSFKGAFGDLFETGTNHCFCEACEKQTVWKRGGEKYVLPTGWYRLGLSVRKEYLDRRSEIEQWPVAYHGTSESALLSILHHQRIMFPGDELMDGQTLPIRHGQCWADRLGGDPVIYVSPSAIYAGAPYYARPFQCDGQMLQAVFQVRVKPSAVHKFPETARGRIVDPEFCAGELEWVIKDKTAVVPYGLLVRCISDPESSGCRVN